MKLIYKLLLLSLFVITSTSCQDPLEKSYNPETFSQDLEAISDSNTVVIKNIINAYQKAGESVNSIAGNEVIMIESSTYKQILENYNQFHSQWKEAKKREFVNELDSLINRKNNIQYLKDNLNVWLLPDEVKDPESGYVSLRLEFENQIDKPITFIMDDGGRVKVSYSYHTKRISLAPIPADDSSSGFIPAYKFTEDEIPESKTQLRLLLDDAIGINYGNEEYSLSDEYLTAQFLGRPFEKEKKKVISQFEKQFNSVFSKTFWPYDTKRVEEQKERLISMQSQTFTGSGNS